MHNLIFIILIYFNRKQKYNILTYCNLRIMKPTKYLIIILTFLSVISCENKNTDSQSYTHERDSILQDNKTKTRQLNELYGILATIADGLDSIALQENILLNNKSRDGMMLDQKQIAANLEGMADILARQRKKIQELQDSLSTQDTTERLEPLRKVMAFLNQQLIEKDRVIKTLRADLRSSKKNVSELKKSLSNLQTEMDKVEKKSELLTTALNTQDDIINECYVKIATRKQLLSSGILEGKFFQRKKINYRELDKEKFTAVDIRKFREVVLKSEKPKILTPLPNSSSYHIENKGDGTSILTITNPTLFWSVSNFLIIQL